MLDLLQEKRSDLADAVDAVNRAIAAEEEDAGLWRVAFILAQAALFSENGMVTEELCAVAKMSEPTMSKKRKRIKELGFFTRGAQGQSEVLFIGFEEDGQCVNALFYPTEITKTRFCKLWQLADFGREK